MIKKFLSVSAVLLSLSLSQNTFATHNEYHKQVKKMGQGINFTTEQKNKIEELKNKMRNEVVALQKQSQKINKEIGNIVTSTKVDESKLQSIIQQKTTLMATFMKHKVLMDNKIYNMLTNSQKDQYNKMMTARTKEEQSQEMSHQ